MMRPAPLLLWLLSGWTVLGVLASLAWLPLSAWLADLADDGALRLALLPEATNSPRELRFGAAGGLLVIGPEGGIGDRDIGALTAAGFSGLRLGPRILRTETAGLAALAALQAMHGDFR